MGHFVPKKHVHVTHEDYPGEYIAIKQKLSLADRNRITGAMVAMNEKQSLDLDMGRYFNIILDTSISGWLLYARDEDTDEIVYEDEEKTKPRTIPFNREYIEDFDPDDKLIDKVLEEIARLNPTLAGSTTTNSTSSAKSTP